MKQPLILLLAILLLTSATTADQLSTPSLSVSNGSLTMTRSSNPFFAFLYPTFETSNLNLITGHDATLNFIMGVDEKDLWQAAGTNPLITLVKSDKIQLYYGGSIVTEQVYQNNKADIDQRIQALNRREETAAYKMLSRRPWGQWCDITDSSVAARFVAGLGSAPGAILIANPTGSYSALQSLGYFRVGSNGIPVGAVVFQSFRDPVTNKFVYANAFTNLPVSSMSQKGLSLIQSAALQNNLQGYAVRGIVGVQYANAYSNLVSSACVGIGNKEKGFEENMYYVEGAAYALAPYTGEVAVSSTPTSQEFAIPLPVRPGQYRMLVYFCEAQDASVPLAGTLNTNTNCMAMNIPVTMLEPGSCNAGTSPEGQTWDEYCWAYGQSTGAGRPQVCDYSLQTCVDPCSGYSTDMGHSICLANLAKSPVELKGYYNQQHNLIIQDACKASSDCRDYSDYASYLNTLNDPSKFGDLITQFKSFGKGAHCDTSMTSGVLRAYNQANLGNTVGVCKPGALSRTDCFDTLGDPATIVWVDVNDGFHQAINWAIDQAGGCHYVGCTGGVTGVNCGVKVDGSIKGGECIAKDLVTNGACTQASRDYCSAYCELVVPTTWGCSDDGFCSSSCPTGYSAKCIDGQCTSCTKSGGFTKCSSNSECYWWFGGSLSKCEGYLCVSGECKPINDRTCTSDSECIISDGSSPYTLQTCDLESKCCVNGGTKPSSCGKEGESCCYNTMQGIYYCAAGLSCNTATNKCVADQNDNHGEDFLSKNFYAILMLVILVGLLVLVTLLQKRRRVL